MTIEFYQSKQKLKLIEYLCHPRSRSKSCSKTYFSSPFFVSRIEITVTMAINRLRNLKVYKYSQNFCQSSLTNRTNRKITSCCSISCGHKFFWFMGHPSNYDWHWSTFPFFSTILNPSVDSRICVSQGEGRSCPWNSRYLDTFSSIRLDHISSFPRMGGGKGDEDGEVPFSQSKLYRYMGQLVWRG